MMDSEDLKKLRRAFGVMPVCNSEIGFEMYCALPARHIGECAITSPVAEAISVLDRLEAEMTSAPAVTSRIPPIRDARSRDHEWFHFRDDAYKSCRKCGLVQQPAGKTRKYCTGVTKLSLRR
jgi:hypothetical protein